MVKIQGPRPGFRTPRAPYGDDGSKRPGWGDTVPPGFTPVRDLVELTGKAFFPDTWTGEECRFPPQDSTADWLGSEYERIVKDQWDRDFYAAGLVAAGHSQKEAGRHADNMLESRRNPEDPQEDGFYFPPEPDLLSEESAAELDARFEERRERCKAIKTRRDIAIVDGLRDALWSGEIPVHYLGTDGRHVAVESHIWMQEPGWTETLFVRPHVVEKNLRDDGVVDHIPRSMFVETKVFEAWASRASKHPKVVAVQEAPKDTGADGPWKSNSDTFAKKMFADIEGGKLKLRTYKEREAYLANGLGVSRDAARDIHEKNAPSSFRKRGRPRDKK